MRIVRSTIVIQTTCYEKKKTHLCILRKLHLQNIAERLFVLSFEDSYVRHAKTKTKPPHKIRFLHEEVKSHIKAKEKDLKNTHQTDHSGRLPSEKINGTKYFFSIYLFKIDSMFVNLTFLKMGQTEALNA